MNRLVDISVVLDATVAEEWPPAAHILTVLDVDFCHDAFFFIVAGTVKKLALRTGNETAAPNWIPPVCSLGSGS